MTKEELQALREENRTLKALVAELLPLKEHVASIFNKLGSMHAVLPRAMQ